MIISASYKTDIPAFYGPWFIERLRAGKCHVINPYSGKTHQVSLRPEEVDGFVLWTRNIGPFMNFLPDVADRAPFFVQYTLTGYPRALDAGTPGPEDSAAHIQALARNYGELAVVWRYDPIVWTSLTTPKWHFGNFSRLARMLEGAVNEVVVSTVQLYRKTAHNMTAAAKTHDFSWHDPSVGEKQDLTARLAEIAADHGIRLTLCAQTDLLSKTVEKAACIDAQRLSKIAGRPIAVPRRPHRTACGCWQSCDIGNYDTCPHGCVYCYAVRTQDLAKRNLKAHNPSGMSLAPPKRLTPSSD